MKDEIRYIFEELQRIQVNVSNIFDRETPLYRDLSNLRERVLDLSRKNCS